MSAIVLVQDEGGDWEALYVDGHLVAENHSLSTRDVLTALGLAYDTREVNMAGADWAGCPDVLD